MAAPAKDAFDAATLPTPVSPPGSSTSPDRYRIVCSNQFTLFPDGIANGGYYLTVAARAILQHIGRQYPDALTLHAHFVASALAGETLEAVVRVVKKGKRTCVAGCELFSLGRPSKPSEPKCLLVVQGTFCDLATHDQPLHISASTSRYRRPSKPAPTPSTITSNPTPQDLLDGTGWKKPPYLANLEYAYTHPSPGVAEAWSLIRSRKANGGDGARDGDVDAWMDLADGTDFWIRMRKEVVAGPAENVHALFLCDAPQSFNYGAFLMSGGIASGPASYGHSTVSLAIHFLNPVRDGPPSGDGSDSWLRTRAQMTVLERDVAEYEITLWRADGKLVAVGRQIAFPRPSAVMNAPATKKAKM
ncbi:thioesterase-like superfamily-domain-containing protein [Hyaloraphidium curvatum]|nr:thioesterase-like superfamily-domain-containing protein [Hyaloraphidium curvatum]